MQVKHTDRGFEYISHPESGVRLVQQSSAIGDYVNPEPGSSFLWYGDMHLSREQIQNGLERGMFQAHLMPHIKTWLKTGSLVTSNETQEDIHSFIQNTQLKLQEFLDYWLKRTKEEPDNYPTHLNPGDWDEQFELFCVKV